MATLRCPRTRQACTGAAKDLLERSTKVVAVELAAFDLAGLEVDALTQKVAARSLVFTGGHLQVRREKEGAINLLTMLQPPAAAATAVGMFAGCAPPKASSRSKKPRRMPPTAPRRSACS